MNGHALALCSPSLVCCTSLFFLPRPPHPSPPPTRPAADPVAMKDFVVAVHTRAGEAGGAGKLTKRAQILLELVVDVKNNRWDTYEEWAEESLWGGWGLRWGVGWQQIQPPRPGRYIDCPAVESLPAWSAEQAQPPGHQP